MPHREDYSMGVPATALLPAPDARALSRVSERKRSEAWGRKGKHKGQSHFLKTALRFAADISRNVFGGKKKKKEVQGP